MNEISRNEIESKPNLFLHQHRKNIKSKSKKREKEKFLKMIQLIKHIMLFRILILTDFFIPIFQKNKFNIIELNYSNITLKIKGTGSKKIFHDENAFFNSRYYPGQIYANKRIYSVQPTIDLDQEVNVVELIWYSNIEKCDYMFYQCRNIIEIDLSHFDSSEVVSMNRMFYECSSLTSINLSNLNTEKVTDMRKCSGIVLN